MSAVNNRTLALRHVEQEMAPQRRSAEKHALAAIMWLIVAFLALMILTFLYSYGYRSFKDFVAQKGVTITLWGMGGTCVAALVSYIAHLVESYFYNREQEKRIVQWLSKEGQNLETTDLVQQPHSVRDIIMECLPLSEVGGLAGQFTDMRTSLDLAMRQKSPLREKTTAVLGREGDATSLALVSRLFNQFYDAFDRVAPPTLKELMPREWLGEQRFLWEYSLDKITMPYFRESSIVLYENRVISSHAPPFDESSSQCIALLCQSLIPMPNHGFIAKHCFIVGIKISGRRIYYFSQSKGEEQIYPLTDRHILWIKQLLRGESLPQQTRIVPR